VETAVARAIALETHAGQRDRFGERVVEHLQRVAAAVPADAVPVAWLHDCVEQDSLRAEELRAAGMTLPEIEALVLLSRAPGESYELYALRIAFADGEAGRLARIVKLADLDDHLAHATTPPGAPPYAWARRHIVASIARRTGSEAPAAGAVGA
jgi:hypothetical protein